MAKRKVDNIHDRIYSFVIKVLKLIKKLPDTTENKIIKHQIAKSVTSMGANDNEADGTTTTRDFIHKYGIVRKEGKETHYWLRVIGDTNSKLTKEAGVLVAECLEIIKIVSAIIYKTKKSKISK